MFVGYVDESGNEEQIMHTAVLLPASRWGSCSKVWLGWREAVNRNYHVPANTEFHASDLLHGNLDEVPSYRVEDGTRMEPKIKSSSGLQVELFRRSLRIIGKLPGAQVVTCHQGGSNRMASYRQLLDVLAHELTERDGHAILLVDGSDAGHDAVHRALDIKTSRIVERPWMHKSHENQFVQVADFAAHAAFQAVSKQPGKPELWSLYETWLGETIIYAPGCEAGIFGL